MKPVLNFMISTTLAFGLVAFVGCTKKEETGLTPVTAAPEAPKEPMKQEDIKVGTGAEAVAGKKVTVHYTGTLTDGKKFDSSQGKAPFTFNLGAGQVIQGWDQGVAGMKVGGKRNLTIPPHLAYGERGAGDAIPPNSTLNFEVELLKVE